MANGGIIGAPKIPSILSAKGIWTLEEARFWQAQNKWPDKYSAAVREDNPVAYWALDESSGFIANDSIGTNHGAYAGATLNQSPLITTRKSVSFTGSSTSGITVPDAAALDLSTNFTLELWAKTGTAANMTLLDKGQAGSIWASYWLRILSGGTVECAVRSGNADTPKVTATTTATVNDNAKHHIAVVFTASSTLKIYIDKVERASVAHAIASAWNTATSLYIANRYNAVPEAYTGVLDEIALYATALSATRIAAHYDAGV